jgi:hypothetical protein
MNTIDDFSALFADDMSLSMLLAPDDNTRNLAEGQLIELEIVRDALGRLRHIKGHDHQGRPHRLEFQWVEAD